MIPTHQKLPSRIWRLHSLPGSNQRFLLAPPQTGCGVISGEFNTTCLFSLVGLAAAVFVFQLQIDAQKYHDCTKLLGKRLLNLNFADEPHSESTLWRVTSHSAAATGNRHVCIHEGQTAHKSCLSREALIVKQPQEVTLRLHTSVQQIFSPRSRCRFTAS